MSLQRCLSCPALFRCVPGDGPEPSSILFIGGQPGLEEDRPSIPMFSGKSGKEFNETYLRLAGLDRDEIRITNSRKCRNDKGKSDPAETLSCASFHLPDEIEMCAPSFIVLMGAAACSLIPDINLSIEHGIPRYNERLFDWTGTIIPMDHPSGGMHDTSMMIPLLEDFARLRRVIDGTYEPPVNPIPSPVYSYVRSCQEVVDSFSILSSTSVDMEDHAGVPFSIQWCTTPGRAYMMRMDDLQIDAITRRIKGHNGNMLDSLEECLYHFCKEIIFHNAPGDLDSLDSLKITLPLNLPIRDTMQEAYHQGNLPQGLKALSFRLLGIRMRSWEEVVGPPSRTAVLNWIESAIEAAVSTLTITEFQQLVTKVKKVIKPHPVEKRLRAIFRYGCYNDEYPIWEHLTSLRDKDPAFLAVESTLGPVPQMGIANCTPEDALEYACKDADMTFRVANILAEIRNTPRKAIYIGDRDVIAKGQGQGEE